MGFVLPHEAEEEIITSASQPIEQFTSAGISDAHEETRHRIMAARITIASDGFAKWSMKRKAKKIQELEWLVKIEAQLCRG